MTLPGKDGRYPEKFAKRNKPAETESDWPFLFVAIAFSVVVGVAIVWLMG